MSARAHPAPEPMAQFGERDHVHLHHRAHVVVVHVEECGPLPEPGIVDERVDRYMAFHGVLFQAGGCVGLREVQRDCRDLAVVFAFQIGFHRREFVGVAAGDQQFVVMLGAQERELCADAPAGPGDQCGHEFVGVAAGDQQFVVMLGAQERELCADAPAGPGDQCGHGGVSFMVRLVPCTSVASACGVPAVFSCTATARVAADAPAGPGDQCGHGGVSFMVRLVPCTSVASACGVPAVFSCTATARVAQATRGRGIQGAPALLYQEEACKTCA